MTTEAMPGSGETMANGKITIKVRLPRETMAAVLRIAKTAGVSPASVIKVAMALQALKLEQERADPTKSTLHDTMGAAEAGAASAVLPAEWLVKVHRLVQGFEDVSGLARLWEPAYNIGAELARWSRATEACADVANLLRDAEAVAKGH